MRGRTPVVGITRRVPRHSQLLASSSDVIQLILAVLGPVDGMDAGVSRETDDERERNSRGRTAAATGSGSTRTGPWPSPWACRHRPWHPSPSHRCRLFSFWGACSVPAAPAGRGAQCSIVPHSLTLRMRKFIRSAGPVGFPAESTRHPNFEKCQSKLQLSRGKFKVEEIRQKIRLRFIHRSSNG